MKVLTFKVPAELDARLAGLAERRGASKSEVVRQLLSVALERGSSEAEGSFLERAKDICGSLDGPKDLSSNKARMKGYGQ